MLSIVDVLLEPREIITKTLNCQSNEVIRLHALTKLIELDNRPIIQQCSITKQQLPTAQPLIGSLPYSTNDYLPSSVI